MTRKLLARLGHHGHTVRLLIDSDRNLITAEWRERGERRKRSWPNTAACRKEARAWAEAFTQHRAAPVTSAPLTTAQLWSRFVEAEFPHLRPKTQGLYREAWRRWEVFVGAESIAEDLGSVTVGEWRASLAKLAPNTFHRAMGTVKTVYAWAYRAHLIGRNDVREYRHKVAKEKVRPRPAEYRQDEFKALLLQFPLEGTTTWRPHLALTLCGYQGVRQNAVLHLRWEDVDLDAATITWRARWDKVGREWSQPLRPAPLAALRAVQARTGAITGWVFPPANRRSRREVWSAQSLWRAIRDAEDKAGITHHAYRGAHGLRRMVFNDALRAGADVASALAVIGDKDLAVANTYLRPREDAIRAAFALLDKEPS